MTAIASPSIHNLIGGKWVSSTSPAGIELINPATGEPLGHSPAGSAAEVDAAVQAAQAAFPAWRATPAADRMQYLFKLKSLLEEHFDELARLITIENGKTLGEANGELRRGIENVEVACGIPVLMQGYSLEDVAPGIDEIMVRQPLGVFAAITPFNFPAHDSAVVSALCHRHWQHRGSQAQRPRAVCRLAPGRAHSRNRPSCGVVNLVHGGKPAVDALLDHPLVRAMSFVGSTPVAKYVYARGSASGKRVQCQGGAKNHVVVLPDADPGNHDKDYCRLGIWLRGAALSCRQRYRHRGRSEGLVPRLDRSQRRARLKSATGSIPQRRWVR